MASGGEVTFADNKCSVSCHGKVYSPFAFTLCPLPLGGVSQSNGVVVIKQVTIPDRQQDTYAMAAAAASN